MKQFLIFAVKPVCYNSYLYFARSLAKALTNAGHHAELFSCEQEPPEAMERFAGRSYDAVFDFNSELPRLRMEDGSYFLDQIRFTISCWTTRFTTMIRLNKGFRISMSSAWMNTISTTSEAAIPISNPPNSSLSQEKISFRRMMLTRQKIWTYFFPELIPITGKLKLPFRRFRLFSAI